MSIFAVKIIADSPVCSNVFAVAARGKLSYNENMTDDIRNEKPPEIDTLVGGFSSGAKCFFATKVTNLWYSKCINKYT